MNIFKVGDVVKFSLFPDLGYGTIINARPFGRGWDVRFFSGREHPMFLWPDGMSLVTDLEKALHGVE